MNYNPLIINLYGAPGSGKSTGGAYIYSELKMRGVNVRMFWNEETEDEGALDNFDRGITSLATSYIEQLTINYCPDVIINTYPLGQIAMCSMDLVDTYYDTIIDQNQKNYLLLRVKPYRGDGRNHTEEESDEIARLLRKYLDCLDVKYSAVGGHREGYECIIEDIMDKLEERKRD